MDRILTSLRQALVEARSEAAFGFSALSSQSNPTQVGHFLLSYCHQASTLMAWLSLWNQALLAESTINLSDDNLAVFKEMQSRLASRQTALTQDLETAKAWLISADIISVDFVLSEQPACQGLKQVRHAQELCARRCDLSTWLCVVSEVERLRMIHGFTFIKLCELHFGRGMLKQLSHIHFQHQQQTALFDLVETLILGVLAQQSLEPDHALQVMKSAIKGYGEYIANCFPATLEVASS